jgi:uncharacterized protein YlxW (UPF0749 family)
MLNDSHITLFSSISARKKIYLIGVIFIVGIYLGIMFFGENSVLALYNIDKEKKELIKEINDLKESNQKLQKDYFELKQLEPKSEN